MLSAVANNLQVKRFRGSGYFDQKIPTSQHMASILITENEQADRVN